MLFNSKGGKRGREQHFSEKKRDKDIKKKVIAESSRTKTIQDVRLRAGSKVKEIGRVWEGLSGEHVGDKASTAGVQ